VTKNQNQVETANLLIWNKFYSYDICTTSQQKILGIEEWLCYKSKSILCAVSSCCQNHGQNNGKCNNSTNLLSKPHNSSACNYLLHLQETIEQIISFVKELRISLSSSPSYRRSCSSVVRPLLFVSRNQKFIHKASIIHK